MESDVDTLDTIIANWGSAESNESLLELLNDGNYEGNVEDDLCGGNCDGVDFCEVQSTGEDASNYTAKVAIDFEEVIHQQCKDANNRFPRTGNCKVTICKETQIVEVVGPCKKSCVS